MKGITHKQRDRRLAVAALGISTAVLMMLADTPVSAAASAATGTSTSPDTSAVSSAVWWGGSDVAGPVSFRAPARRVSARYRYAVRTSSLGAVNAAYRTRFAPYLSQSTGYFGNPGACQVGAQSPASRGGTLSALNFVRSLGGLAPISFSAGLNQRAQFTAMLMSANQQLSHYPSRNWRCWNPVGASNAAKANLALSWPRITSGRAISLYMQEPGSSNTAVGHRRWLMNPDATQMGSGATHNASAITVIGPTGAARPNPPYVGWPTAGYFPNPLEPSGRWSLSAGDRRTSFVRAQVQVHRAIGRHWVRVATRKHRVHDGYARPTLVWQVFGVSNIGTYRVTVSGIKKPGVCRSFTHSYVVRMFTPR